MNRRASLTPLSVSPDSRLIAGIDHQRIVVYDVATGKRAAGSARLPVLYNWLVTPGFARGSRYLIVPGRDHGIQFWSTRTWRVRFTVETTHPIEYVAYSPATNTFAAICDGGVRVWAL
ncbi:MAG: WD40 repeat domain-containing protein [Armatimonadetes bacterium]|nr:WD40 repeat domain-containing protein [Armatimonadota bacterium]MDE2206387.1 WD40 repeat domain-containing protein [Armatimonadota bacterium]